MGKGLTLNNKEEGRAFVLNGVLDRRWSVEEASRVLGVGERQVWRLLGSCREDVQQRVAQLAQGPYDGATYSHLADLLREREGVALSRWTVRRMLKAAGISSSRRHRSPQHRSRRERSAAEGIMLRVDGSRHQWLGPEAPWPTVVCGIDDATGTVPYAVFREQEDAQGYLLLLQRSHSRQRPPLGGLQ